MAKDWSSSTIASPSLLGATSSNYFGESLQAHIYRAGHRLIHSARVTEGVGALGCSLVGVAALTVHWALPSTHPLAPLHLGRGGESGSSSSCSAPVVSTGAQDNVRSWYSSEGRISDLRVYNGTLTDEQVGLHGSGAGRYAVTACWFPMIRQVCCLASTSHAAVDESIGRLRSS